MIALTHSLLGLRLIGQGRGLSLGWGQGLPINGLPDPHPTPNAPCPHPGTHSTRPQVLSTEDDPGIDGMPMFHGRNGVLRVRSCVCVCACVCVGGWVCVCGCGCVCVSVCVFELIECPNGDAFVC